MPYTQQHTSSGGPAPLAEAAQQLALGLPGDGATLRPAAWAGRKRQLSQDSSGGGIGGGGGGPASGGEGSGQQQLRHPKKSRFGRESQEQGLPPAEGVAGEEAEAAAAGAADATAGAGPGTAAGCREAAAAAGATVGGGRKGEEEAEEEEQEAREPLLLTQGVPPGQLPPLGTAEPGSEAQPGWGPGSGPGSEAQQVAQLPDTEPTAGGASPADAGGDGAAQGHAVPGPTAAAAAAAAGGPAAAPSSTELESSGGSMPGVELLSGWPSGPRSLFAGAAKGATPRFIPLLSGASDGGGAASPWSGGLFIGGGGLGGSTTPGVGGRGGGAAPSGAAQPGVHRLARSASQLAVPDS